MARAPPPTLFEKIGVFTTMINTVLVALTHFVTSPIRSGPRPNSLFKDVMFRALRYQLGNLNVSQEAWMNPSTESNYLDLAKKQNFQPDTLVLNSGCKAHWFGNKSAKKIIMYLHGGGYVLPCSPGHVKWLYELTRDLSKSYSVTTILLGYTCSPEAHYPTQLTQAAELLDHLINVEGRNPSDIIVAGDSAGGNLTLALLSHILHPHPEVPTKLNLSEPLCAAILISPWVNFDVNQPCFDRNVQTDMLCKPVGKRWAEAFLGPSKLDNYNQPVLAGKDWFAGLDGVISGLLIWGGGGEVLIDSIDRIVWQLKDAFPGAEYIKEHGACHEDFIIEKILGYTAKAQGTTAMEEWISSRL